MFIYNRHAFRLELSLMQSWSGAHLKKSSESLCGAPQLEVFRLHRPHTTHRELICTKSIFLLPDWMELHPAGVESDLPSVTRGLDDTTWQAVQGNKHSMGYSHERREWAGQINSISFLPSIDFSDIRLLSAALLQVPRTQINLCNDKLHLFVSHYKGLVSTVMTYLALLYIFFCLTSTFLHLHHLPGLHLSKKSSIAQSLPQTHLSRKPWLREMELKVYLCF